MASTKLLAGLMVLSFGLSSVNATAEDGKKEEAVKQKTFVGTWNNRKYNSSGPLKCVARPGKDGNVLATFTGTFKGDPFKYDVEFLAKPGRNQTDLSGKATISGHIYKWTGSLIGGRLRGRYLGTNGYNGEFVLNEIKSKSRR